MQDRMVNAVKNASPLNLNALTTYAPTTQQFIYLSQGDHGIPNAVKRYNKQCETFSPQLILSWKIPSVCSDGVEPTNQSGIDETLSAAIIRVGLQSILLLLLNCNERWAPFGRNGVWTLNKGNNWPCKSSNNAWPGQKCIKIKWSGAAVIYD